MSQKKEKATETGPKKDSKNSRTQAATLVVKKRLPKMQAVIMQPPTEGKTYAEVLNKAKAAVNLEDLQITVVNTRRTKAGSILLEVKRKKKANLLAQKLQEADVGNIRRPMRTKTLLLMVLDIGTTEDEIRRDIQKGSLILK